MDLHRHIAPLFVLLSLCALCACADDEEDTTPLTPQEEEDQELYRFDELPEGVPAPRITTGRALTKARVELGRYLFYDERLSGNQSQSCASCHVQEKAFTDGRLVGLGSTGEEHVRNAMSLANVAYNNTFGWASHTVTSLEDQATIPMFGEDPIELGLTHIPEIEWLDRFAADARYGELFANAYPDLPPEERVTNAHIVDAIADFERTLLSFDSPYDRYVYGDDQSAMSDSAKRGMRLFFSERLECFHCHGGFNFSDAVDHEGLAFTSQTFHNTGLYNVDARGAYPDKDRGLYDLTGKALDMGRFKAPTLRNIAVTAPYFHDGSAATLEEAIAHYERGGRAILTGEFIGDGSQSPLKSELIQGFILTDEERTDLIAFLEALTDETFLSDPRHARPPDLPPPPLK